MRRLNRHVRRALIGAALLLTLSILRDIGNVTTRRLYLAARIDAAPQSDATEHFDVEQSRVVPQIAIRDHDRIAFAVDTPWPSTLRVGVRAPGASAYEVRWRDQINSRVLARGTSTESSPIAVPIPARAGVLELVNDGPMNWVDPQVTSALRITGRTMLLAIVAALAALACRRERRLAFTWVAGAGGVLLGIVSLEVGLRALGDRAPAAILKERHDLGEVRRDARWVHTSRYGRRLRPFVDDVSEWRHGDIVRMGFVPEEVSDGLLHRYPFHTDAEGFRNARTRERIDVAALGDSFTDAMTLDEAGSWPSLLEKSTGLAVQNYGTAGFGPQQELRVLTDYALTHHPRIVVLAFFAGNDIFDAEAFDDLERSNGATRRPDPGWPIRTVVRRADSSFVVSAVYAATHWAESLSEVEATSTPTVPPSGARSTWTPGFDRGLFTISVNGTPVRWAFMPPYLNVLRMSEQELSARRGWPITRAAIAEMRDRSRAAGAELIVMYLPSKSQVYLPLADAALPREQLVRALRYSLPDGDIDVDAMLRQRSAQNTMLRRFCGENGIPFLDTTLALAARLWSGVNVYYPDESHLNETGHAVVADALGSFLKDRY